MDPPEKLEQSEISKNKGTDYFKACSHFRMFCDVCWNVDLHETDIKDLPYILAYKSLSRISCSPKNRVRMWSKISDPRISRRWLLRTCTGCKLR